MHPGAAKSQEQQRKLQSILNKITLCNFSTLVEHLSELNVDMEEILKLTIELIFQNAVSEQNYCMAYAGICFHLMKVNYSHQHSLHPVMATHNNQWRLMGD